MFKRLNLADVHCTELRIVTHLRLSRGLAERIIEASHGHKERNVPSSALYGCIYTLGESPYAVRADVRHVKRREYHIEFRYVAEKWPKPPKDVNSPQILATALTEEPQEVILECDVYFVYNEKGDWRSAIEIPMVLAKREKGRGPFTHIEAIRLSKREEDQIRYFIEIGRTEEGAIQHWVHLTEVWKDVLSEEVPGQLLERSMALSRAFLTK